MNKDHLAVADLGEGPVSTPFMLGNIKIAEKGNTGRVRGKQTPPPPLPTLVQGLDLPLLGSWSIIATDESRSKVDLAVPIDAL